MPFALFAFVAGCSDPATREWTAQDHDQPSNPGGQVEPEAPDPTDPQDGADPALVTLAWKKHCMTCHGLAGRGDGPQGPMVKAPDLTRTDWLESVTDAEIEGVIRGGKNKMPAFGDLPDDVIAGLVTRIRAAGKSH